MSRHSQQWDGESFQETVTRLAAFRVIAIIIQSLSLRAPAFFELIQPIVVNICFSKTKFLKTILAGPTDGFPHYQIIACEMLKLDIRGAEFVDYLVAEMKINRSGNRPVIVIGQVHKTLAGRNDVPVDIFEKGIGLGRQPMTLARDAMKPVIFPDCIQRVKLSDFHIVFYRFTNFASII